MKYFLILFLPLFGMVQEQALKPIVGFYAGVGTYMLQGGLEGGVEVGRVGVMADLTRYHQGVSSYGGKVAVKGIYFDVLENEYLSAVVGWTGYSVQEQGQKFNRQSALLAIRWTCYNVITDAGWKDGGFFFSIGWQFRKINRY